MKKILSIAAILAGLAISVNAGETFMGVTLNKPLDSNKWNCKQELQGYGDLVNLCRQRNGDPKLVVWADKNYVAKNVYYFPNSSKVGCTMDSPWVQKVKRKLESKYGQLKYTWGALSTRTGNVKLGLTYTESDFAKKYGCSRNTPNLYYLYEPVK